MRIFNSLLLSNLLSYPFNGKDCCAYIIFSSKKNIKIFKF